MSFWDNVKKFAQPYAEDDYDDYDEDYEDDYEEPAEVVEYEHVHGEWTVSIEAGVGTAGEKYTHCQECGSLITEQIPAIPEDGNDDLPEYIDPDGIV